LVHSTDPGRVGPKSKPLCDEWLAADGIGASSCQQFPLGLRLSEQNTANVWMIKLFGGRKAMPRSAATSSTMNSIWLLRAAMVGWNRPTPGD
jgi:hypothetical protein